MTEDRRQRTEDFELGSRNAKVGKGELGGWKAEQEVGRRPMTDGGEQMTEY